MKGGFRQFAFLQCYIVVLSVQLYSRNRGFQAEWLGAVIVVVTVETKNGPEASLVELFKKDVEKSLTEKVNTRACSEIIVFLDPL